MNIRIFAFLLACSPTLALVADDHGEMKKEHQAASAEHQQWASSIKTMQVEHLKAMAVLARLQAELLAHEAELKVQLMHIEEHDAEMAEHSHEIAHHEKSGDDSDHEKFAKFHEKLMKRHKAIMKSQSKVEDHHGDLIKAILKLGKDHRHGLEEHSHDEE